MRIKLIPECLCSDWDSPAGGMGVVLRMQTSVFELLTCCLGLSIGLGLMSPECYVMQERGTGIEAEYG